MQHGPPQQYETLYCLMVLAIIHQFEEMPARLKRELALRLYEKGLLSFGKARELAGMTKWEFSKLLGEEDILCHYDLEELSKDLEVLEELD